MRGRTLDIGCNDGHYSEYISGYVGIDSARFKDNVQGVMQSLPFSEASFDNVLMSEVLEHVYDRIRALREARRVLKPGGRIIVTTPFGRNPWKRVWFPILETYGVKKRKYVHGEFPSFYMKVIFALAGFTNVHVERPFWFQLAGFGERPRAE